jgi:hypothetical protein
MKEIKKGQNWRMGYQVGYDEALTIPMGVSKWKAHGVDNGYWQFFTEEVGRAFGGCKKCYGKGYATTLDFTVGSADFQGDVEYMKQNPIMRFCDCERGKQLQNLWNQKLQ